MKKKNNTKTIALIAAVVLIVGALYYFGGRNKTSAPPIATTPTEATTIDPMHGGAANISSAAALDNLVDKQTPSFSLTDKDGTVYSSENLRGKNVVLFFTEGLMCYPACWNQIVALAKDDRFKSSDTVVLSVVVDSKEDWQRAIDKMPELAQATVVFDNGAAVSKEFDMLRAPSSMHPGSLPGHTFVLIDKEGVVRYVFDDPQMAVRNDQIWAELAKLVPDNNNQQ